MEALCACCEFVLVLLTLEIKKQGSHYEKQLKLL